MNLLIDIWEFPRVILAWVLLNTLIWLDVFPLYIDDETHRQFYEDDED